LTDGLEVLEAEELFPTTKKNQIPVLKRSIEKAIRGGLRKIDIQVGDTEGGMWGGEDEEEDEDEDEEEGGGGAFSNGSAIQEEAKLWKELREAYPDNFVKHNSYLDGKCSCIDLFARTNFHLTFFQNTVLGLKRNSSRSGLMQYFECRVSFVLFWVTNLHALGK
jgi:hypothetical protein